MTQNINEKIKKKVFSERLQTLENFIDITNKLTFTGYLLSLKLRLLLAYPFKATIISLTSALVHNLQTLKT